MLPLVFRLKNEKAFNALFRKGRTISEGFLLMKYGPTDDKAVKVGFSAGLKFSKKATERNKVKRWMREACRALLARMKPGHQMMFIVNSNAKLKEMSYQMIEKSMKNMLKRAKII